MTLIKFCGMTREVDVVEAAGLGVDAVGFVLWPRSPRSVDERRLASLIRALPARVQPVGVFVRPTREDVDRAVAAGIRVAQLHGVGAVPWETPPCEIWIAAALAPEGLRPDVGACTVLLDVHDAERHGGTGRTIDWRRAAAVAAARPVWLAGGLTPANVAEAIRTVRPVGVDVASGIEERPGVKSADAMRAFVAAVREAEAS
jgi:phosphoribosylanthranilate isomerase